MFSSEYLERTGRASSDKERWTEGKNGDRPPFLLVKNGIYKISYDEDRCVVCTICPLAMRLLLYVVQIAQHLLPLGG